MDVGPAATVQNSLLASNSGGNCSGSILDQGHNLTFAGGGCPVTFASADPNLGPLDDNGGPTQTISLGSGSAALDKVPPTGAGCQATDQRGVPRPVGSACDIGAYESAGPKATTAAPSAVGSTTATLNGSVTPNAGTATVEFDYGTTTKYGAKVVQTLGGVTATPVLAKVSRLKPKTVYHFRIVVTALDGTVTTPDRAFTTSPPPVLSRLKIKPSAFRAGGHGATITYTDSQPAKVTFVVLRPATGVKHGKRCVAPPTRGRARGGKCTRFVAVGTFTHTDKAGANSVRFTGKLRGRKLARGSYRLEATGRANGQTGKTVATTFRITG